MSAKPVSLSAHRNKVESRRKRELANNLVRNVGKMVKDEDIRAYAIVGIGASGSAFALWDTGAIVPMWSFADTIAHVLRTDIVNADIQDDWRPTISPTGAQ